MPDAAAVSPEKSPLSPVAVVTGATEGIGYALAREFARGGHDLLLVARTRPALEQAASDIAAEFGVRAHVAAADLSTPAGCAAVETAARKNGLYVEYLINNAGFGQCGPFAEADAELLTGMTDLHVRAITDLTRRFLPGMIERDAGGVLNVSSLAGFLPGPYQATYYATKAFAVSLSEALAHETAGTRVKVSVLAPGPANTRIHERMESESAYYIRFQGSMSPERIARIGYANFMCGQRVIIPGMFNMLTALSVRFVPHSILVPFAAWLLRKREETGNA